MKAKDLVFKLMTEGFQVFHRHDCKNGGEKASLHNLVVRLMYNILSLCSWLYLQNVTKVLN